MLGMRKLTHRPWLSAALAALLVSSTAAANTGLKPASGSGGGGGGGGTVTNVTATAPLTSSGGATPNITTSVADQTILGNNSGSTGAASALTVSAAQTMLGIQNASSVAITGGTIAGVTLSSSTITGATITASTLNMGGNAIAGNTTSAGTLTLNSTSHATKGMILLGSSTGLQFNEVTNQTSIGIATPDSASKIHAKFNGNSTILAYMENANNGTASISGFAAGGSDDRSGSVGYFMVTGSGYTTSGDLVAGSMMYQLVGGSGNIIFRQHQSAGTIDFATTTSDTIQLSILNNGTLKVGAASQAANGSVATAMSSLGPTGSHTTIQEWLTIQNSSGTQRWIPMF